MSTERVMGLFILTWILIGMSFIGAMRRTVETDTDMPRGSIEKEFNGIKYYLVPVRSG